MADRFFLISFASIGDQKPRTTLVPSENYISHNRSSDIYVPAYVYALYACVCMCVCVCNREIVQGVQRGATKGTCRACTFESRILLSIYLSLSGPPTGLSFIAASAKFIPTSRARRYPLRDVTIFPRSLSFFFA